MMGKGAEHELNARTKYRQELEEVMDRCGFDYSDPSVEDYGNPLLYRYRCIRWLESRNDPRPLDVQTMREYENSRRKQE